jgi:hypothetical protein
MEPVGHILNTAFPLLKYTLPPESTAIPLGWAIDVLTAVTGVAGRAPPASVVIVYDWAKTAEAAQSAKSTAEARKTG